MTSRVLAIIGIVLVAVGFVLYVTNVLVWCGLAVVGVGAILFYAGWWRYRRAR